LRRVIALWFEKKIPISTFLSTPIEEMPTNGKYDLIVIINVIEHCYDINLVFDNIIKIASPNAILVFHDKYYDHQQVVQMVQGHYYESGHPLMVDRKVIDRFLVNFEPLFRKIVRKKITHIPGFTDYDGLFFIGRIKDFSSPYPKISEER
jgi:SAM-dependent methyltransferase